VCSTHRTERSGSVVVRDPGSEPTPQPTASPTPTPTPTPTATPEPPRDMTPAPRPAPWAAIDRPGLRALTVANLVDNKLRIVARCVSVGSGTLTLTVTKAVAARLGLRSTTLDVADAACDGHGRFTVRVRPSAQVRRALEDFRGKLKVKATLTMAGPTGATTATRTINLKGRGRA
jgi:hypothetical protein